MTVSPSSRWTTGQPSSKVSPDDRRGDGQVRPELVGLRHGALGQLAAGDAGGEAEVVLDPHAAAGLPPGPDALQHERAQPLRGPVDGGGQPGRAGPDHHQVVGLPVDRPAEAEGLGQLADRWACSGRACGPRPPRGGPTPSARTARAVVSPRGSASGSSQVNGIRFLARKSRSRKVSCEWREPITLGPIAGFDSRRCCRRARNARMKTSPRSGCRLRICTEGVIRHLVDLRIAPRDGADDRRAAGHLGLVAGELAGPEDRDRPSARRRTRPRSRPGPT